MSSKAKQGSSPKPKSPYNLRNKQKDPSDDEKHDLFKKHDITEDLTEDSDQNDPTWQVGESSGGDTESDSYEQDSSKSEKILGVQKKKQTKNTSKASSKPEKSTSRESSQPVKYTSTSKATSIFLQFVLMAVTLTIAVVYGQDIFTLLGFNLNPGMKNTAASKCNRPVHHRYGNLTHELEVIQKKYAKLNLGEHFWDLIVGSSWSHLENERSIKQPVVLLLVAQPGSHHLNEVAKDIGKMFAKTFTQGSEDLVHIDGANHGFQDMGKAKLDIDRKLKEEFDRGGKVALVSQFDKLPGCTVMLFHSYCDSDNAPYKDVVILFTFQLTKRVPLHATPRDIEEAAQEHLNQAWSQCPEELTKDKVTAMHSRVSNNIGFVSEI